MKKIKVNLGERSHEILIGKNILKTLPEYIPENSHILLITDKILYNIYGKEIQENLSKNSSLKVFLLPQGEKGKNIRYLLKILEKAASSSFDRHSLFLCLGGGSIGDTGGFAASIYMRGVKYIQIPTTLLAMVDSSIGGKTAIDFYAKNIVGAFHQPYFILSDIDTLKTLPERNYINGFSEVIKYGMIKKPEILSLLKEKNEEILEKGEILEELIYLCASIKVDVVEKDEKEKGLRMILNFGHTIGHAIEAASNFKLWHGEAISLGMITSSYISWKMGLIKENLLKELEKLLSLYSLPVKYRRINQGDVKNFLVKDKKIKNGKLRFVLIKKLGEVEIREDVPAKLIWESLDYISEK